MGDTYGTNALKVSVEQLDIAVNDLKRNQLIVILTYAEAEEKTRISA